MLLKRKKFRELGCAKASLNKEEGFLPLDGRIDERWVQKKIVDRGETGTAMEVERRNEGFA